MQRQMASADSFLIGPLSTGSTSFCERIPSGQVQSYIRALGSTILDRSLLQGIALCMTKNSS